ncbi:MAG TPA: PAS domain-containing sensor histidine kinase [Candidatus Acidoferrales bacterium]|nr:PAS domain-containing sensor histidine kinase [Candidatus Acidoferrales bacterium]
MLGNDDSFEQLTNAEQIRLLSQTNAARHYPVKLRGVVTFFDEANFFQFIQDETAGIYLQQTNLPRLLLGQRVEVEGVTSAGDFAPVVTPLRVAILGDGTFPQPKPVSYEQLISGGEDSQFVQIQGIVRAVGIDPQTKYYSLEIASGGGRFTALMADIPAELRGVLVDSTVKILGVCATHFNSQRQLFDVRLLVPRTADLTVEKSAPGNPENPFDQDARSIEQLLQFTPHGAYGHRVKVCGVVIYRRDDVLYIQDGKEHGEEGLYVETKQATPLVVGEKVEVVGFPATGDYTPMLQDAIFRKIGDGPAPVPVDITVDEALKGTYDCRLVRIEATLLDRARHSREQFVVLQSGGNIFHAYLQRTNIGVDFAYLQNNSKVAVTGVCRIEPGNVWQPGAEWRAKSFRILLRSPADIFVLAEPPWWTLEKMLWATGILGMVVLTALAWVLILRRRVHKQTAIIRRQLQAEATLKERYKNLFENANDMVFTHDLQGRITSINQVGEKLLRRHRGEILFRNLVEFVANEQRETVTQWLAQVATGAEVPSAEWDYVNAVGQRLRLEVSARLVEQSGEEAEVECVARDITERKGLEREILEISNREQRRIGHDLHDGVCQQLAAIAYRMDILGDQLQEKGVAESSEAERIGALLNEAVQQTRSVARGLFPVRLDESGLESALKELAANTSALFRIHCQFSADQPFPKLDTAVSLHLYYIAQEAVSNAAKHGKATNIIIAVTRVRDHFTLCIQDNGSGFTKPTEGSTGMGIRIMRYRARMIGSTLDLKSRPNQGTQINVQFTAQPEINSNSQND